MKPEFYDYLNDIRRSLELTQQFTAEMSFEDFNQDEKTQYAVIRCLEVIGEAVKRIPEDYRNIHQLV